MEQETLEADKELWFECWFEFHNEPHNAISARINASPCPVVRADLKRRFNKIHENSLKKGK